MSTERYRTSSFASITSNASGTSNTEKSSIKSDKMDDDRKLLLLSQVIPPKKEYEWWEIEIVVAHETIRRNALRGEKALECMNIVAYPWQMKHFHLWLSKYFFEVIQLHEHTKQQFMQPFYQKLGETAALGQHDAVVALISSIEDFSQSLLDLVLANGDAGEIVDSFNSLKSDFTVLADYLFDQFRYEEQVWGPIYQKHGEALFLEAKRSYVSHSRGRSNETSIFEIYVGGCFVDMGLDKSKFPPSLPTALRFHPWMTGSSAEAYAMKMGAAPRKKLIPEYMLKFLKWNALIEACSGVEDIVVDSADDYGVM